MVQWYRLSFDIELQRIIIYTQRVSAELEKLERVSDQQEDENTGLKDRFDDMEEKYKAMESTLQNAYKWVKLSYYMIFVRVPLTFSICLGTFNFSDLPGYFWLFL